jgi:hypothetical protein
MNQASTAGISRSCINNQWLSFLRQATTGAKQVNLPNGLSATGLDSCAK